MSQHIKTVSGITASVVLAVLIGACSTPEYSALNQYKAASNAQLISYYVCMASSARAEGRMDQAYHFDQLAWSEMASGILPQQRIIWIYQQAVSQGQRLYFHRATDRCWRWSVGR